jgi:signal transduction histidine kinase
MARTDDLLHLNRRLIDQNKIIKSANLQLVTISNELQDANSKIREHADLKSRFVSMASHEFRTPLANIKSNAWYIKKYYDKIDKNNVLERVQKIDKHIDYMTALLDDVLTIGKSDAVKLVANVESVNLHQFVNKIVQEVQTANGNTHQVHVYLCENVPDILDTDEKFLKNIFINLLNNAIRYSPLSGEVWLNIYRNGDEINFEVCDKGLGISPGEQEKIFEPFYRSDITKDIQGTGLGLSIVKRAAELLNGKVNVDSEVGKGSTFTVTLLIRAAANVAIAVV